MTWSLMTWQVGALDTYLRHTPAARLLRWLLGRTALRVAGACAAWLELLVAPLALAAPSQRGRRVAIAAAAALHVGIAMTMRNTIALSLAGVCAWLPLLDGPLPARTRDAAPGPAAPILPPEPSTASTPSASELPAHAAASQPSAPQPPKLPATEPSASKLPAAEPSASKPPAAVPSSGAEPFVSAAPSASSRLAEMLSGLVVCVFAFGTLWHQARPPPK
jgi:hypothetical protein